MRSNRPARAVVMIRPVSFDFDNQTAKSNAFQNKPTLSSEALRRRVNTEFTQATDILSNHGIDVTIFEDRPLPAKPNAVFPNNWLSTWPDGRIFLYPMATESRRIERNSVVIDCLKKQFEVSDVIDLSSTENNDEFLESTGVMIFDHINKMVYGSASVRCNEILFNQHARALGYTPYLFHAYDTNGIPIYHTNVLMGVQSTTAVVCLDTITNPAERKELVRLLESTGHTVVAITREQMAGFCGNVLELENKHGEHFLALSQTAYDTFTPKQRAELSKDKQLLPLAIPTIETVGGGSIRCMLAEIFLQQKNPVTLLTAPSLSATELA